MAVNDCNVHQSVNSVFKYLIENNFLSESQSGFRPVSCEFQLLSIVHGIYGSFVCNPLCDVTGIFVDISKALTGHDMIDLSLISCGIKG